MIATRVKHKGTCCPPPCVWPAAMMTPNWGGRWACMWRCGVNSCRSFVGPCKHRH